MKYTASLLQLLVVVAVSVHASMVSASETAKMTPVDILSLPTLSDPEMSPNGDFLVYVKREPNWDKNKSMSNLWLSELETGLQRQVTYSDKSKGSPNWSPDGRFVSFLADAEFEGDDDEDYKAIYLLPTTIGEAVPVGEHLSDVKAYEWGPNSDVIYFLADQPLSEKGRKQREADDDMHPFDEPTGERHLWRVSVETGEVEQLTADGQYVRNFDLSADGRSVVFSSANGATIDDKHTADLWKLDVESREAIQVTHNDHAESGFELSPNNKFILFIADVNSDFEYYYDANLFIVPIDGGTPAQLGSEYDFEVEDAQWSADSSSIYVQANMGVRSELWRLDIADGNATQITNAQHTVRDWSYNRETARHIFVSVRPESPGEIYIADADGSDQTVVTREFEMLAERYELPTQELVVWRDKSGVQLEGLLSLPGDYKREKPIPLIVDIHGGPRSSVQYGQFRWRTYIPIAASDGFAVFSPNHRGGRGYGDDFMRDMVGGYFKNAHLDVLSGVDFLVDAGIADPNQLIVSGWSAGGHMVNKLITHTDRFRAASSGAGAVDWVSMYGESDTRYGRTAWFGGKPWQADAPLEVFDKHSPLHDLWKTKTPTLIFVGENDERVPPTQSILLYRALDDLGVDTKLYIAPREGHGFSELRHRLFKINAELAWYAHYLNRPERDWQEAPD
ncbi:MAG: S9 family peptidase [Gammaproteobacteria bacterium]|nr:S9 family peptidase [Gammaproteobacteria bacterium]